MPEPHDVIVFGPGAMGLVLARYFFKDGQSVGIVGKERWADLLGEKGALFIRYKAGNVEEKDLCTPNKNFQFYGDQESSLEALSERGLSKEGLILLSSKTPNLEEVLDLAERVIDSKSNQRILMIQNGIYPELRVQRRLSEKFDGISSRLASGIVMANMAITDFTNPTISYGIAGIILGSWEDFEIKKDTILAVENILKRATYGRAEVAIAADQDDYRLKRFEKAALNGANVLSTLFKTKVGGILDNPNLNLTMREKLLESVKVARAEGMDMDELKLLKTAHHAYDVIVRNHYASMAQDLQMAISNPNRLLVTEIGDLDSAFAEIGESHRISTPFNKFYGGLMEDFTLAYNMLKSVDSRNGSSKATEFANEFLSSGRIIAGLEEKLSRLSPETLATNLYSRFQELKEKYLGQAKKEIPYSYSLETITGKPSLYILVVDDEKGTADIEAKNLRLQLRNYPEINKNYEIKVIPAYSAKEAIEVSRDKNVAVVLSDEVMPEMKGHEMAQHFSPYTSFVLYSGKASSEDRSAIRRIKTSEYLHKVIADTNEMTDAVIHGISKYEDSSYKGLMF